MRIKNSVPPMFFMYHVKGLLLGCVSRHVRFQVLLLNLHQSFTNRIPGISIALTICFQTRLWFNMTDLTPVSVLFPMSFLSKTSDFRFETLFFQDPQLDGNFRSNFRDHGIIKTCAINRSRSVDVSRYQVFS